MTKTLNQAKNSLINLVEKSKNFFNKASMNNFINKILKSNSFDRVDGLKIMLNNINKSQQKFRAKDFKKIENETITERLKLKIKTIKITYDETTLNNLSPSDYVKTVAKKVEQYVKNNKLVKTFINYPRVQEYNSTIPKSSEEKPIYNAEVSSSENDSTYKNLRVVYFWKFGGYDYNVERYLNKYVDSYVEIKIYSFKKVQGFTQADEKRLIQQFENSDKKMKCVPYAILKYFTNKLNQTESNHVKKNIKKLINKIKNPIYNKKYTIQELESLSKEFEITITIRDLINKDIIINPKQHYNIILLNTQYNHIDLYPENEIIIKQKEEQQIKNNNEYYHKVGNRIITAENIYIIDDDGFGDIFNQFKEENLINRNFINADSKEMKYIDNYYFVMHQIFNHDNFKVLDEKTIIEKQDILMQKMEELEKQLPKVNYKWKMHPDGKGYDDEQYDELECEDDKQKYDDITNEIQKISLKIFNLKNVDDDDYNEYDLINAYYNLTNNSDYGVPSNAFLYYDNEYCQQIETHIKENKVGYYHILLNTPIDKILPSLEHVMTTPQIMKLKKYSVKFQIKSCLISPKIKLNFNENTLKKFNNVRAYAKITGIMLQNNITKTIEIKTNEANKYVDILKQENPNNYISLIDNIIEIHQPQNITLKHIGLFIHSYVVSEVLDFIFQNDVSKIIGVKLDSIIVEKDYAPKYDSQIFKLKPAKIENIYNQEAFIKPLFENVKINYSIASTSLNSEIIYSNFLLCNGKGGAGKTQSISENLNLNDCIYCSLAWERGVDFRQKYKTETNKIIISSIPKILNAGVVKTGQELKIPKTTKYIILDEPTLISEDEIIQIKNKYYDKIIILVGDIDADGYYYQCALSESIKKNFKVINPSNYPNLQIINYTQNYRFESELNNKLDNLRQQMRIIKAEYNENAKQCEQLEKYILNEFKQNITNKQNIKIDADDMGISGLQESNFNMKYTKYFINRGSTPKFYTIQTFINKDEYRGQTSENITNDKNQEIRLFSTIHSTQGKTVSDNGKVIIIIEKTFDFNLWYTALSRARRLDQIKIITKF
jgi:hypothetical protein